MADHNIINVGYQPIVAMNNIGQVVGIDYVDGTIGSVGATPGVTPRKIVVGDLASDGQVTNKHVINTPYKNVDVFSINDSGQILGSFDDKDGTGTHYFYTNNGEFNRLPLAYTNQTSFFDGHKIINNAGQIAGGQYLFNPDGTVVTLSDPNAAPGPIGDTEIIGLNNDGIVLGSYNQQVDSGYQKKFFIYSSSTGVYTDLPADLRPEAITTSGVFGVGKGGGYVFEGFDGSTVASGYSPADGNNTPITLLPDWVYFNTGSYVLTANGRIDRDSTNDDSRGPFWEIPVDPADYKLYGLYGDQRDEAHLIAVNDKGQILAQVDHRVAADSAPSYKPVYVESFDILETTALPPRGASSAPKTPIIKGTVGGQTTTDEAPLQPFAHVTIGDPNVGASDTLTITLRSGSGTLKDGAGFSGLTQTAPDTYKLKTGTPDQLTAELQALVFKPTAGAGGPGTTSTTLFELLVASSAGPTAGDRTTTVYDTIGSGSGGAGGVGGGGSTDGGGSGTGGTGSPGSGSPLGGGSGTGGTGSSGSGSPLGGGTSGSSGASSPPTNNSINPSGSDAGSGPTTVTTTGITGQPYVTSIDRYDSGVYQGSTWLNANGKVYFESSAARDPDGGATYTYAGGSFFRRKPYASFTDSYDAAGLLTRHVENGRDGSHSIAVDADGQTVSGLGNDTFTDHAASTRFVFGPGLGAETIYGFDVAGPGHDTLDLAGDAGRLARILSHVTGDGQGTATLHLDHGDTITLAGVSVAALKHHKGDFTFHA